MDFNEIMSFCGYDLDKANDMVKEYEKSTPTYPKDLINEILRESGID